MLLIVSTVFVCLNLPSCLLRIEAYWEVSDANIMPTHLGQSQSVCLNIFAIISGHKDSTYALFCRHNDGTLLWVDPDNCISSRWPDTDCGLG